MNTKDLRSKNQDEILNELSALVKEQFNLRMQKGAGQIVKTSRVKQIRRNIARINTILTEKAGV